MDQTTTSHFPKKSLPILLSISAFSILFSFSFLPLNDFSQLVSYITDKNYIFLFCNGILVIIIKSSGLASNSSPNSDTKHEFIEKRAVKVPVAELAENKANHREVVIVESEEKQVCDILGEEEQVRVYESLGEEEDERDEYENVKEDDFFEVEDEGFELLSTEELNKKCDDFIKKMREGIKIQA